MLISLTEYAAKHGKNESSARRMALRGRFCTAEKIGRNWVIDENEPWPDYRTKAYRKDLKKMAEFEYTDSGKLIIDGAYIDLKFPNGEIFKIEEDYYLLRVIFALDGTRLLEPGDKYTILEYDSCDGKFLADHLRFLADYQPPEYFEPLIKPMEKITFPVEYREDL